MSYGFDFMFSFVPFIVTIGFLIILGLIIARLIQSGRTWSKNNNSPVLTVNAKVVAKRMSVNHHHHSGTNNMAGHSSSSTDYFVTFQVDSGDRMELRVPNSEYGMLVEGDTGSLTFQGTRYKGFVRTR